MTLIVADIERKLQDLLEKFVKEREKNGLTINSMKTEYMLVSKRKIPRYERRVGDARIK